jgi:hypothetical protein
MYPPVGASSLALSNFIEKLYFYAVRRIRQSKGRGVIALAL